MFCASETARDAIELPGMSTSGVCNGRATWVLGGPKLNLRPLQRSALGGAESTHFSKKAGRRENVLAY